MERKIDELNKHKLHMEKHKNYMESISPQNVKLHKGSIEKGSKRTKNKNDIT